MLTHATAELSRNGALGTDIDSRHEAVLSTCKRQLARCRLKRDGVIGREQDGASDLD